MRLEEVLELNSPSGQEIVMTHSTWMDLQVDRLARNSSRFSGEFPQYSGVEAGPSAETEFGDLLTKETVEGGIRVGQSQRRILGRKFHQGGQFLPLPLFETLRNQFGMGEQMPGSKFALSCGHIPSSPA